MKYKFNYKEKTVPFPHQAEAINFMKREKEVALFDEMGLGKTKIVIDTFLNALAEKSLDSVLIV